ncbi:hypothetical protein [Cupriavidus sp. AcVe19-6a]|uniref:hypothetical protein n=1 Tax=Cupriavidus sp. AcVe19-6a TaxID=2821358 RepID=UPI001AE51E2B|nr:hypothetical protein [Cupriavidus sp. AcVe19-6a]MBP0638015.1 hypothetical protein [Cupriavidus sp. AcVe19-6a]
MALRIIYRDILRGEVVATYLKSQRYAVAPASEERDDFEWPETKWCRMSWALPSGLMNACRFLGLDEEDALFMLNHNTFVPALARLMPDAAKERLIEHHLYQSYWGVSILCGLSVRRASQAWRPAFCRICLAEDLATIGEGVWRIQCILNESTCCLKHQEWLFTNCEACGAAARSSLMTSGPSLKCLCGHPRVQIIRPASSAQEEVEFEFASALSEMLDVSAVPKLQYEAVLHLIQNQMKNLGIFGGGRIHWGAWDDFTAETPYSSKMDRAGLRNGIRCTLREIKRGVLPRKAVQMLLLLLALFGGWRNVVDALRSKKMASEDASLTVVPTAKDAGYRKTYRRRKAAELTKRMAELGAKYQQLKKKYPRSTHAELKSRLSRSEQKVLTLGRLKELGIEPAPRCDGVAILEKTDASLAEHIARRAKTLRAIGFSGRLSSCKLRQGFPCVQSFRKLLASGMLPEARKALRKHEETPEDYLRRLLKSSVAEGFVSQIPAGEEGQVDSLSYDEVKRLHGIAATTKQRARRMRWGQFHS